VQPQTLLAPMQREIWGYRRKARLSVRFVEKKGRALVGFREANGRYVAEIEHCPVLDPRVGLLIGALSELVSTLDARASVAQIEVAAADRVVLVFRNLVPLSLADRSRLRDFGLKHDFDMVLQPAGLDSLVDLDGAPPGALRYSIDEALELNYQPLDFVQVNDSINRAMIVQALDLLQIGPDDHVLDLYCGLGNFTLPLARQAATVFGVEGDAGLIARARANALAAGIGNVDYAVADLTQDHRDSTWARADYSRMLLDPPRAGAERVFDYLPKNSVERLVYVSCHPGTLARDAAILVANKGFDLVAAGVMDMFPHTAHVESMALFVRR
jgi:23S rRNA (uracil1939-C5)-methyltransferase